MAPEDCHPAAILTTPLSRRHIVWGGESKKMRKQFLVGDKIICTKNSAIPIYVDEGVGEGGHEGPYEEPASLALKTKNERLMNGNLYKIRASPREYFVFDDLAGEVIRDCPKLLMNKTKINHTWALSIYKFQGREAEQGSLFFI